MVEWWDDRRPRRLVVAAGKQRCPETRSHHVQLRPCEGKIRDLGDEKSPGSVAVRELGSSGAWLFAQTRLGILIAASVGKRDGENRALVKRSRWCNFGGGHDLLQPPRVLPSACREMRRRRHCAAVGDQPPSGEGGRQGNLSTSAVLSVANVGKPVTQRVGRLPRPIVLFCLGRSHSHSQE